MPSGITPRFLKNFTGPEHGAAGTSGTMVRLGSPDSSSNTFDIGKFHDRYPPVLLGEPGSHVEAKALKPGYTQFMLLVYHIFTTFIGLGDQCIFGGVAAQVWS
jgi:hypothetical protein